MRLIYVLTAQKPKISGEALTFTNALLLFYQDIKKQTSVFEAVVMMTDKRTGEYQILAISVESEEEAILLEKIEKEQEIFLGAATEAGVIVKSNIFEATICDENFTHMLWALNPASI